MLNLDYPLTLPGPPGPLQAFVPIPDPDTLAACAVAFANADGGTIIIGLADNGAYTGPPDGVACARALAAASEQCNPPVPLVRYELVATPSGPALAVRVARSDRVHALPDGRVLARASHGNRELNGDEIRALVSARTTGDFDAEIVPGATPRDLDPALLADFMLRRAARHNTTWKHGDDLPLEAIGAITPDARVTVAGLLLFGHDPQQWLPASGVHITRLLGSPSLAGGKPHTVFERELRGALVPLLDQMWDTIQSQMRASDDPHAMPDYPPGALREALINAVCHRDYRRRDDSVRIRIYSDQITITSPGALPGFMTPPQLFTGRYSRNPRISWTLHQWGYIDRPGRGVMHLIHSLDRFSHRPPEIEAGPQRVTVRLYSLNPAPPPDESNPAPTLTARQREALDHVHAHGSITLAQFRALCPDVRADVLARDLAALVESEHLRKIGSRNGAYFIRP